MRVKIVTTVEKDVQMCYREGHVVVAEFGDEHTIWAVFPGDESEKEARQYIEWKKGQAPFASCKLSVAEYEE